MLGQNGKIFTELGIQGKVIEKAYLGRQLIFWRDKIVPMPVVLWDKKNEEMVQTTNIGNIDNTRYEPIGIIVIPASHDVYGTGECGVMALLFASKRKPDFGEPIDVYTNGGYPVQAYPFLCTSNAINICDIIKAESNIIPIRQVVNLGNKQDGLNDAIPLDHWVTKRAGEYLHPELPVETDPNNTWRIHNPLDDKTIYSYGINNYNVFLPSPYLSNGKKSPLFFENVDGNALIDFDGKNNTEYFISKSTKYPDWKSLGTIPDEKYGWDEQFFTAECCCWRFHTAGTTCGDWYLPAVGELCYIPTRYKSITTTLVELGRLFGKMISLSNYIISSSVESVFNKYIVSPIFGGVDISGGASYNMLPFTRMLPPKQLI